MVGGYLYHVYEQVIEQEEVVPAVYEDQELKGDDDVIETKSILVKEAITRDLVRFELRFITNSAGEAQALCEGESGKFVYTYTQCWWGMPN